MSRRWVLVLVLALLLSPGALAHGETNDGHTTTPSPTTPSDEPALPQGYTGPGREPYLSYFQGTWFYGQASATPLPDQAASRLTGDGDWLVWEDLARADLYVHHIPSGQGFYATNDRYVQRNPRIDDGLIVYEDHRNPRRPVIMSYDIETGETRKLSNSTNVVRDPVIQGDLVAWIDENGTNPDLWAYDLTNQTAWAVNADLGRDGDPAIVGERIFWRAYRYTIWDVLGYDTRTGELVQITADAHSQSAPFTNGEDLLFLTNDAGWRLIRYDAELDRAVRTAVGFNDASRRSASGDALVSVARDVDYSQLVITNLTSGASNHVSGDLVLATDPLLLGDTVYAILLTADGRSLLSLQVSPFAFAKRPSLTIASPASTTPWLRPLVISGSLEAGPEFTEPATFTYRIDDEPPQLVPPGKRWRFTVDPQGFEPGSHLVTVRATFLEGPPVVATVTLVVPLAQQSVDVAAAGPAYHAARIAGELNLYVLQNPAAYVLIPLLLILLVLLAIRLWIWLRPRRRATIVEYVTPDEA